MQQDRKELHAWRLTTKTMERMTKQIMVQAYTMHMHWRPEGQLMLTCE